MSICPIQVDLYSVVRFGSPFFGYSLYSFPLSCVTSPLTGTVSSLRGKNKVIKFIDLQSFVLQISGADLMFTMGFRFYCVVVSSTGCPPFPSDFPLGWPSNVSGLCSDRNVSDEWPSFHRRRDPKTNFWNYYSHTRFLLRFYACTLPLISF